jgi:lipoic acid synthetase
MVGLGETFDEVIATMHDIRDAGTDALTIGQYLQPHARRLPVERWWRPEEFATMRDEGRAMGFSVVESGPLVRSSYHARAALGDAERGGETAAPL